MKLNTVPVRAAVQWVKLGIRTFLRQPLALSGLFFMFMAAIWIVGLIPWVGPLLKIVLVPAGTLGMMVATQEVAQGRFPMPTLLLVALRSGQQRALAMLKLGVWWAGGIAAVLGICSLIDGGELAHHYLAGEPVSAETLENNRFVWALMTSMALNFALLLFFWQSPALTYFGGLPPVKSLFFSMVASKRNFGAYLVFSLLLSAVQLLMILVVVAVLLQFGGPPWAMNGMPALVMLLSAMTVTSIFFVFRDTFDMTGTEPEPHSGDTP
jgi:hypothetical protein